MNQFINWISLLIRSVHIKRFLIFPFLRNGFNLLLPLLLTLHLTSQGSEPIVVHEHELKAALIYNFLKFVEWPEARFSSINSPLIIGVTNECLLSTHLRKVITNRKINGHSLVVKVLETPEDAKSMHALCFNGLKDEATMNLIASLQHASVLTIGESEAFAQAGGMIIFIPEADKIRFEINIKAVETANLKISAQLQKLARSIRR